MEKVKVKRYVSGKRPDYAPMESSDEEDEDFQFVKKGKDAEPELELEEEEVSDPRLKRLLNRVSEDVEERYVSFSSWLFFQTTFMRLRRSFRRVIRRNVSLKPAASYNRKPLLASPLEVLIWARVFLKACKTQTDRGARVDSGEQRGLGRGDLAPRTQGEQRGGG